MRKLTRTLGLVVALCAVMGLTATSAGAIAEVDANELTCESFSASGTTTAPFVVVEVYDNDAGEDLFFGSFAANSDGTFSVAVTFEEVPEGTNIERWVWGSPTNDPDDWDTEDYFFEEATCVAAVDPPTTTTTAAPTTTVAPAAAAAAAPAAAARPAAVVAATPAFTG